MQSLILTLHIVVCVLLVILILLQSGKEGMGVIFGGGNTSVFGNTGAGGILVKLTTLMALIFVVTSLSYTYVTSAHEEKASTILDVKIEEPVKPEGAKEAPKPAPDASAKTPDQAAKPAEQAKPAEAAKPAEQAKPAEAAKPAEQAKPAEAAKPAEQAKPAEATKPAEQAKPAESKPTPSDATKSDSAGQKAE